MTEYAWTPGPLGAHGEHKAEHGEYVYMIRETQPKGMIAGWPMPVGKFRRKADAQMVALAPEMAEAILEADLDALEGLAERLHAINEEARDGV